VLVPVARRPGIEVLSVRYGDPLLSDVSPLLCLLAKEELERV